MQSASKPINSTSGLMKCFDDVSTHNYSFNLIEQLAFLPRWCHLIIKYHWYASQTSKPFSLLSVFLEFIFIKPICPFMTMTPVYVKTLSPFTVFCHSPLPCYPLSSHYKHFHLPCPSYSLTFLSFFVSITYIPTLFILFSPYFSSFHHFSSLIYSVIPFHFIPPLFPVLL